MNKNIIIFAVLSLFFLLVGLTLFSKRRPLPFQEVIALDKGIALVNSQKWFMDNLQISYSRDDGDMKKTVFDENGIYVIDGLVNGQEYMVEIRRTDLKGMLLYSKLKVKVSPHEGGDDYYVLVGASVGKAWNIAELPDRLKLGKGVVLGNRTVYQFDKSDVVNDLTNLPFPISGVILKECSAYFPRDFEQSKKGLISWIEKLNKHNVKPVLATTVPVTAERANGAPDKQKSLLQFNDFIRQYAQNNNLSILDLEKSLRISANDRHLRNDYAQDDGVHLVGKAYSEALDQILFSILEQNYSIK